MTETPTRNARFAGLPRLPRPLCGPRATIAGGRRGRQRAAGLARIRRTTTSPRTRWRRCDRRGMPEPRSPDGRACRRAARPGGSAVFADRRDAGRGSPSGCSAPRRRPVVVALPRGGVPVGFESQALAAPLDVLVVRKLGSPHNPELGGWGRRRKRGDGLRCRACRERPMAQPSLDAPDRARAQELRAGRALPRGPRSRCSPRRTTIVSTMDSRPVSALARYVRCGPMTLRASWLPSRSARRESVAMLAVEADEVVCHTIRGSCWRWALVHRLLAGVRRGSDVAAGGRGRA